MRSEITNSSSDLAGGEPPCHENRNLSLPSGEGHASFPTSQRSLSRMGDFLVEGVLCGLYEEVARPSANAASHAASPSRVRAAAILRS